MRKNAPNSVPSEVGGLRCAASKPQCSEWNCRSLRRRPAISGRLLPTGSRWFWRLLQQKPKPLKQTGGREESWSGSGSIRVNILIQWRVMQVDWRVLLVTGL